MKNQNLIIAAVVALVIGTGAGFFGGIQYEKMKTPSVSSQFGGNNGGQAGLGQGGGRRFGGGTGGGARGGAVTGEILSASDNSITVKLADGSSKIVLLTGTTTINKAMAGSKTDLTTGAKVAVFGMTNSDGSVTAQSIQLNPMGGPAGMQMGGGKPKNTGTKSADAKEIDVSGQNYSFTPNALTVPVGQKTRIVFTSSMGVHDFVVDELNIRTATVQTGDSDWVEFTPTKAGTYQFYCSVGNHKAMGMIGTLTVQ